jgi:hypothetical protein
MTAGTLARAIASSVKEREKKYFAYIMAIKVSVAFMRQWYILR